ncbi:YpoC family protein [Pontibacillus salicampi]|uniref:YpoC family protein n=1 Tax=Pontibacillus salicampi TaxID=1449801 RepID=A0ABV6LLA8_9BACI
MHEKGKEIIQNWKQVKEGLHVKRKDKDKSGIQQEMLLQVEYAKEAICLVNDVSYEQKRFYSDKDSFTFVPWNVQDRLEFIEQYPAHYQAFIQLDQLYKELEKIYARAGIVKQKDQSK